MKFLLCVLLSFSSIALAQVEQQTQDVDDIFAGGTREFEFERFDDDSILMAINQDARIACNNNGLCKLTSVTSNDMRFTAQFNFGEGNMWNSGLGGTGTNIIIPGTGANFGTNQPYYGVTLKFTAGKCTQTVNVPRSVYYAINRYMYGLMTEEGGTRRGFTPADEAMIMFYTTVMKQATGCVAAQ
jgi:hypothetical protein